MAAAYQGLLTQVRISRRFGWFVISRPGVGAESDNWRPKSFKLGYDAVANPRVFDNMSLPLAFCEERDPEGSPSQD